MENYYAPRYNFRPEREASPFRGNYQLPENRRVRRNSLDGIRNDFSYSRNVYPHEHLNFQGQWKQEERPNFRGNQPEGYRFRSFDLENPIPFQNAGLPKEKRTTSPFRGDLPIKSSFAGMPNFYQDQAMFYEDMRQREQQPVYYGREPEEYLPRNNFRQPFVPMENQQRMAFERQREGNFRREREEPYFNGEYEFLQRERSPMPSNTPHFQFPDNNYLRARGENFVPRPQNHFQKPQYPQEEGNPYTLYNGNYLAVQPPSYKDKSYFKAEEENYKRRMEARNEYISRKTKAKESQKLFSPSKTFKSQFLHELQILVKAFSGFLEIENKLQALRNQLFALPSFNPQLIFHVGDEESTGFLSKEGFVQIFIFLKTNFPPQELDFLFGRFNQKFSWQSFLSVFLGNNEKFDTRRKVNQEFYGPEPAVSRIFEEILFGVISQEKILISLQNSLPKDLDAMALFKEIDVEKRGFIAGQEISKLMANFGVNISSEDKNSLMKRLSKYNSGRINFNDFVELLGICE